MSDNSRNIDGTEFKGIGGNAMSKRILCKECKWCYLHITGKTALGTLKMHHAECRRHPPKEVWDCFTENNTQRGHKRYNVESFTRFPQVDPDSWWCGEAEE